MIELVEGPTLADRLANGPLPVEEAFNGRRGRRRYFPHTPLYDVTPDGPRFLFAASTSSDVVPTLNVSVHWVRERR